MDKCMRVARRFAMISTAGELAIEFGVLPWRRGHVESAAAWAFKRWVDDTGGAEGVIEDQAGARACPLSDRDVWRQPVRRHLYQERLASARARQRSHARQRPQRLRRRDR